MSGRKSRADKMIWACLLHLSFNMWAEEDTKLPKIPCFNAKPYLRFDTKLWNDLLRKMVTAGLNMVVIDLGDAVRYKSHPEIAVRRAWTTKRLRNELAKLRKMGLEPIPKLNFATTHDHWLGPYSRCVSTDTYYAVCRDLIAEVAELFDAPRLFHIGMDEEEYGNQTRFNYAVVRQHELWWHDFYFLVDQVEKAGARAWTWSDYFWHHPETASCKMPKSVVQSNWYYGCAFDKRIRRVKSCLALEAQGFDQIPCCSNHRSPENFEKSVAHFSRKIAPQRLLGFVQTIWRPTIEDCRARLTEAIEAMGPAIAKWNATH